LRRTGCPMPFTTVRNASMCLPRLPGKGVDRDPVVGGVNALRSRRAGAGARSLLRLVTVGDPLC
jgi:hypothetical protein